MFSSAFLGSKDFRTSTTHAEHPATWQSRQQIDEGWGQENAFLQLTKVSYVDVSLKRTWCGRKFIALSPIPPIASAMHRGTERVRERERLLFVFGSSMQMHACTSTILICIQSDELKPQETKRQKKNYRDSKKDRQKLLLF